MKTMTKRLRGLAVHAMVLIGAFSAAEAGAISLFTVNPNFGGGVLSSSGTAFQATAINGFSSNRISYSGVGSAYSSDGYAFFNGFALNNVSVSTGASRVNLDYGLYAVFHQTLNCSGPLSPGVSCVASNMSFQLYADPGNDNLYTAASLAGNPLVDQGGSVDILLASSSVLYSGMGGLDALGGAYQNLNIGWTLTAEGSQYFTSPSPFYNAAFTAFNNTSQGLTCDTPNCVGAQVVAIASEAGILDFNANAVPEPGALALTGIGMLGLLFMRRRAGR
jgi:hypothetical protein